MAYVSRVEGRKKPWRVRVPEWQGPDQKAPPARFFATRAEADRFVRAVRDDSRRVGRGVVAAVDAGNAAWVDVVRRCELAGVRVVDAAAWGVAAIEGDRVARGPGSATIEEAADLFLADAVRRGLRPASVSSLGQATRLLAERFGEGCDVAAVDAGALRDFLVARYPNAYSRGLVRTRVGQFFRFCAAEGWIDSAEWLSEVRWRESRGDVAAVEIMGVDELRVAFDGLGPRSDPEDGRIRACELRPALALAVFAGIRPAGELMRMEWRDVDFRHKRVTVRGEVAKMRRPRVIVEPLEPLWDWLALTPRRERVGRVCPMSYRSWRKRLMRVRESLGWDRWKDDVTRHTFASVAWQVLGMQWTYDAMGHEDDFKLLAKRYRVRLARAEAEAFLAVRPG